MQHVLARQVLAVGLLASIAIAQAVPEALPKLKVPTNIRAALFAMKVQPPPASGQRVRVINKESKAPIAGAHVFVIDGAKMREVQPRIKMTDGRDFDRLFLAYLLWSSDHYMAGADGVAVVPDRGGPPMAFAVTPSGWGMTRVNRRDMKRANPGGGGEQVSLIEIVASENFTVRALSVTGKPVADLNISFGFYGERGIDRFEVMFDSTTDSSGEVRVRMSGIMISSLRSKGGRFVAQANIVGAVPVRVPLTDGNPNVLEVPLHGRVIVRLHDETEQPLSDLESVRLLRHENDRPPQNQSSMMRPGQLNVIRSRQADLFRDDEAQFHFVALGQPLVALVRAKDIAGEVVHVQDGPTRSGELVVFAVRTKASSPILATRLLDIGGQPVLGEPIAVQFVTANHGARQVTTTGPDGALRVVVPERLAGAACRVLFVRRGGSNDTDTVYAGSAVHELADGAAGLMHLGDLQLKEEQVIVRGRLCDENKKPIAGIAVAMPVSWFSSNSTASSFSAKEDIPGRAFVHRATTDSEGRFVFRELMPRNTVGTLTVGDGKWLCESELLAAPSDRERVIVASKVACIEMHLGPLTPSVSVKLLRNGVPLRSPWRQDRQTGVVRIENLRPGTYGLHISVGRREQVSMEGLEVRAGETCSDPRLRKIEWSKGFRIVQLTVRDPAGVALRPSLSAINKAQKSRQITSSIQDQEIVALTPDEQGLVLRHRGYQTVLVERLGPNVNVVMVPRRRVRIVLPDGLQFPAGTALILAGTRRFTSSSRAIWVDEKTELLADGVGPHRLSLRAANIYSWKDLWSAEVKVPEGPEPIMVTLAITAKELQDVREKLAVEQSKKRH